MATSDPKSALELPVAGRLLVVVCAAYNFSWGILTLINPTAYLDWSGVPEAHFYPGLLFWAWIAVLAGGLYAGFLMTEKLKWMVLPGFLGSLSMAAVTVYEAWLGNLSTSALGVHLLGDLAGTIGFFLCAIALWKHAKRPWEGA